VSWQPEAVAPTAWWFCSYLVRTSLEAKAEIPYNSPIPQQLHSSTNFYSQPDLYASLRLSVKGVGARTLEGCAGFNPTVSSALGIW
jgi:hypothetical protein